VGREEHRPLVDVAAVERRRGAPADGLDEAAARVPPLEQRDLLAAGGVESLRYLSLVRREENGLSGSATTLWPFSSSRQSATVGSV